VTNKQKEHHTFSSTAGVQPTTPTILGMVIEEVRVILYIYIYIIFDPISSFADRSY